MRRLAHARLVVVVNALTGADHTLGDVQLFYARERVASLGLVVGDNLRMRDAHVELGVLRKAVELLQEKVENVQPAANSYQRFERALTSVHTACRRTNGTGGR